MTLSNESKERNDAFMKAYQFYAVTYDGEVYCTECLPDGVSAHDSDVHPIFADSEWDYTPICEICGAEHDYMVLLSAELEGID